MSEERYYKISGLEHSTKQPFDRRYALFCRDTPECESRARGGHLGDFATYQEALPAGNQHPHPVLYNYFEITGDDNETIHPSPDFMEAYQAAPEDHVLF